MSTKNEVTALGLRRMWSNPTGEQDSSAGDTKAVTYDTLQQTPGIWKNRGMDLLDSPDLLLHLHHGREFRVCGHHAPLLPLPHRDDVMKPPPGCGVTALVTVQPLASISSWMMRQ